MSRLVRFCNVICSTFLDLFFPPRQTDLLVRNLLNPNNSHDFQKSFLYTFIHTGKVVIRDQEILTLLIYSSDLVQALVLEAKFHRSKKAQRTLGEVLARYLLYIKVSRTGLKDPKLVLIPIPLGKKRRKERGYNQIEQISKYAVKHSIESEMPTKISMNTEILHRIHETTPQTSLNRAARLKNMQGAFIVPQSFHENSSPNSEIIYIIVDDVVTTGSTLLAAKEALSSAGAKNILMLALAH